jgi:hypothetical protein
MPWPTAFNTNWQAKNKFAAGICPNRRNCRYSRDEKTAAGYSADIFNFISGLRFSKAQIRRRKTVIKKEGINAAGIAPHRVLRPMLLSFG